MNCVLRTFDQIRQTTPKVRSTKVLTVPLQTVMDICYASQIPLSEFCEDLKAAVTSRQVILTSKFDSKGTLVEISVNKANELIASGRETTETLKLADVRDIKLSSAENN